MAGVLIRARTESRACGLRVWRAVAMATKALQLRPPARTAIAAPPYRFTDHPEVVARFRRTFDEIAARRCGVLVTPHPSVRTLVERMRGEAPLDAEDACRNYASRGRGWLDAQLAKEAAEAQK